MEIGKAILRSMSRFVLDDSFRHGIDSLLVYDALHDVVEGFQADVSHLVLLVEEAHAANQVDSLCLLGVQPELLDRFDFNPQSVPAQTDKIFLLVSVLADQELEGVRVDACEVFLEELHAVSVGKQEFRPVFVQV
jgi:hypothetical protein